jgi:hypothetical protein
MTPRDFLLFPFDSGASTAGIIHVSDQFVLRERLCVVIPRGHRPLRILPYIARAPSPIAQYALASSTFERALIRETLSHYLRVAEQALTPSTCCDRVGAHAIVTSGRSVA